MVLNLTVEEVKKIIDANINGTEIYQIIVDNSNLEDKKVTLYYNGSYHKVSLNEADLDEVVQYRNLEVSQVRQDREERFLDQVRYFIDLL